MAGTRVGRWMIVAIALAATVAAQSDNPPMPGFDGAGSDDEAIAIADEVMEALGGRQAWDETRYLTWKFFGRRTHVWDKHTGNLRYENDDTLVLMNLRTKAGRVWKAGQEVTDAAARDEALQGGESAWINDSYWMFMPYKLKDTGVTLKYLGKGTTLAGDSADVLELTFENVGRTPENKYHVYVDDDSRLVVQWDYFPKASDPEPRFQLPWLEWERQGGIMLSPSRGERRHEDVYVLSGVPDSVFESPEPVSVTQYKK
jgi:hypothetical protein